jgi:hypothetical protein
VDMQREFAQEVYIMRLVTSYDLFSCTTGTIAFCNKIILIYQHKPVFLLLCIYIISLSLVSSVKK